MIMARKGLLERQSLEDSALMAHGEDLLDTCKCAIVYEGMIINNIIILKCVLSLSSRDLDLLHGHVQAHARLVPAPKHRPYRSRMVLQCPAARSLASM